LTFILLRGKVTEELALHGDDMARSQKKQVGLSCEHAARFSGAFIENVIGDTFS